MRDQWIETVSGFTEQYLEDTYGRTYNYDGLDNNDDDGSIRMWWAASGDTYTSFTDCLDGLDST